MDVAAYHGGSIPFVWVNLSSGLAFGDGDDLLSGMDDVTGTEGGDTIQGDGGRNRLEGRGGDDVIRPFGGDDVVVGGTGRDMMNFFGLSGPVTANLATGTATGEGSDTMSEVEDLTGGNGNDSLTGDANPNIIDGSNGVDSCVGGGGLDTFFRCE